MPTQEILRDEWALYFEEFSRRHQGWLVTVEILGLDIGDQVQVRNLPLEGITVETNDDGDEMTIIAGSRPDARISHTICAPLRVWVKQNEQGADEALEIESPAGAVLVRFRSAVLPELVDGILAENAKA
ncbi:MAG TPA: DUF5335 family protein [Blastocatellia bacterium]|nr:DUF5335 family protein [Blastocatellia bacterium]